MTKYCNNCGAKLDDGASFCHDCGKKFEVKSQIPKNTKIIIALLCIIISILLVGTLITSGIFNPPEEELQLEEYDFIDFTMLVPKDSNFKEYNSVGKGTDYWAIGYENTNNDNYELVTVWISNYDSSSAYVNDFVESDGDLDVYEPLYEGSYMISRYVDGYYIQIANMGGDLDNLKEMARSIEVTK